MSRITHAQSLHIIVGVVSVSSHVLSSSHTYGGERLIFRNDAKSYMPHHVMFEKDLNGTT